MVKKKIRAKRFQRTKEDFICEKCGREIQGDGFTNHCPCCLFSKHVDIYPGDRRALCGGLMEPVALEKTKEGWKITHECLQCDYRKKNKSGKGDSFETLVALASKLSQNRN